MTVATWPDLAGRIERREDADVHVLPVRVYFEDTDFSGLVYHASYVRWIERGRSDFLRLLGVHHHALAQGTADRPPAALAVRRLVLDYLKPARIDDVIVVETRLKALTAATCILDQRVLRDGEALVRAEVTAVLLSLDGRVLRVDRALKPHLDKAHNRG
jgi:acyl-CoA thioester hydrolase